MGLEVVFSKRFENIMKLTSHLAKHGRDTAQAKAEAMQLEGQFLNAASSNDDYQQLCDDYVDTYRIASSPSDIDPESQALLEEIFNTEGPTIGRYEWATFHAEGVTSTVYKAKKIDDEAEQSIVALKVMNADQLQPPHNAYREVRILQKARADSIVPLLDSFKQPGGKLVLIFPFLRQDLENLLRTGNITRKQCSIVLEGLLSALSYLHVQGIIHRDIKPANVLLRSMEGPVYLIDFGIAWAEGDPDSEIAERKITDVGTTCYRPPEILFGCRGYDGSLDMWAAGCVVAEMVTNNHYQLFDAGPLGSELSLIKSMFSTLGTPTEADWPSASTYPDWGKVNFQQFPAKSWREILPTASHTAIDFVRRTVCYESTRRMTAREALDHPLRKEFES
ncbi:mitogen-activated protein kinase [Lithohypha guttulata]|nr:mitogen-activated protein kinase [Lithohypha guttulata]